MHVFMCRICKCVGGGADCGGVFRPKRRVAGEEVCVQVSGTHRQTVNGEDYGWLVNLLAFHLVCVTYVYLCVAATDPGGER